MRWMKRPIVPKPTPYWHRRFAWRPTIMTEGIVVWLEWYFEHCEPSGYGDWSTERVVPEVAV